MDWKAFWTRALLSCNPNAYSELVDEKLRTAIGRTLLLFLFTFILMAVVFVPVFFVQAPLLELRFAEFSTFEFGGTFEAPGAVTLLDRPRIVFDRNASSVDGAQVVIANDGIYYRPYYWFGEEQLSYDAVKSPAAADARVIQLLALFLWPSIIFWSGLVVLVKYTLLALVFGFLGWALVGLLKQRLTLGKSFRIGLYAVVPPLVLEMVILPFWRNGWVFSGLSVLVFILGISLVSERKVGRKGKQ